MVRERSTLLRESDGSFMRIILLVWILLVSSGCVPVSNHVSHVMPLDVNTAQVLVEAESECGKTGAQRAAFLHAAVATLQRGLDRFVVLSSDSRSELGVRSVPITSTTYYNVTTTTGGTSYYDKPHHELTIAMFRYGDPSAAEALDARHVLGPDWVNIVSDGGPRMC